MSIHKFAVACFLAAAIASPLLRADSLDIHADQPGVKISPMLYGLMTEEINYSYQGGLYAELIQNRDFKDDKGPTTNHWALVQGPGAAGTMALDAAQPVNTVALTTSLRLDAHAADNGQRVGIANDGYWGIPVKPNTTYRVSFYARAASGFSGPISADIESADGGTTYAQTQIAGVGAGWKHFTGVLKTSSDATPTANARFVVSISQPGTVWFSLVSLFPPTYHDRPNGTRVDLMEKMAAMHPAFLRFPGGNYLEGDNFPQHFDWKKTIGDISLRPGHRSPWNYHSTDGFGILEFLEWCEDLKMAPVLAVFGGFTLNHDHVTGAKLQPYVQDALDEIEYVTGDTSTTWGARRAADGHPAPFALKYVEINNEDFFDHSGSYDQRFQQFYDAIKAKYPDLRLIATTRVHSRKADLLDEHFYPPWSKMVADSHHYDNYDRNGPKVFVGEWASQHSPPRGPTPAMAAALGDSAWMIGMERNSDLIPIQCYAPLLVNVNPGGKQWDINLIGYDALNSFGSPSYYAFCMFSANHGDTVLPVSVTTGNAAQAPQPHGKIGVGAWNTQAEYKDIEVSAGGRVIYRSNFGGGSSDLTPERGNWSVTDGALRESTVEEDDHATVGSTDWTDYTIRLKARKIGGKEGFLIRFHETDDNNYVHANLGGWDNQFNVLEKAVDGSKGDLGRRVAGHIENNRWYDIRIELQGTDIRCYLDDKLVLEGKDEPLSKDNLIATASRDEATGDVILKAVNPTDAAEKFSINVKGVSSLTGGAGQVLAGDLGAINTLDEPENVAPKDFSVGVPSPGFAQEFPPHSVTVLRLKTR